MKIYIAAHKPFTPPKDLPDIYTPLQVGAALHPHFAEQTDDTGENISAQNPLCNELTALYWLWKNSREDIVGLCHYRRYFVNTGAKAVNLLTGRIGGFLTEAEIREKLLRCDMIVHNPTYFPRGNRNQFEAAQGKEPLRALEKVLRQSGAADADAFQRVMQARSGHLLNMFIADKAAADAYAAWLFPILQQTERELHTVYPQGIPPRTMGMLGERLLDVWITKHHLRACPCFTVNTERVDRTPW